MIKQFHPIILKLFFLLTFVIVNKSVSSEQLLLSKVEFDQQRIIEEWQSLTDQIKYHSLMGTDSIDLYVDRGNLMLVAEEFHYAIDDFTYAINFKGDLSPSHKKLLCKALWGRMWGYALLEQEKEVIDDLNLYPKRPQTWNLDCAKAPGFDDRKRVLCC
jgi:hypothetical protein